MVKKTVDWKIGVPPFSSKIEYSWAVAEKVNLFDTIIVAKKGLEWWAFRKGTEQPTLFGEGLEKEIDLLGLKPVAMGLSFEEVVCRASLVLASDKKNEQTSRSNQQCNREPEKVSS
jgi:hypothetical protein